MAVADRVACGGQLGLGRSDAPAVVVQMTGAGVRDVECTVREFRKCDRARQQVEQFGTDLDRSPCRFAIDARQFRRCLVRAHQRIDAMHLGHHGVHGIRGACPIVAPEFDVNRRAHDRLVATEPATAGGRVGGRRAPRERAHGVQHGGCPTAGAMRTAFRGTQEAASEVGAIFNMSEAARGSSPRRGSGVRVAPNLS